MKNNFRYGSLQSFLGLDNIELPFEVDQVFGRTAPLEVEIGFGTGEYLARLGQDNSDKLFLGFEQCAKRIIKTLRKVHDAGLTNVRVARVDAVWAFRDMLKPQSLQKVYCLFPCPWPKKRHVKFRLFQPDFLKLINSRLIDAGVLEIVTDHAVFADWVQQNIPGTGFSLTREIIPPQFDTKFEKKWRRSGQEEFFRLILVKTNPIQVSLEKGQDVKVYFCNSFNADNFYPQELKGDVSVQFSDIIFDVKKEKVMVHALVSEDRRLQHVWVMVSKTEKGWCTAPAAGTVVLPIQGVKEAIRLVAEAVEASGNN